MQVEEVLLPRSSELVDPAVANVDFALLVFALSHPPVGIACQFWKKILSRLIQVWNLLCRLMVSCCALSLTVFALSQALVGVCPCVPILVSIQRPYSVSMDPLVVSALLVLPSHSRRWVRLC